MATRVADALAAPTLTRRLLRDISLAAASKDFRFVYDGEGVHGQPGSFYMAFTAQGLYEGQRHILRGRFSNPGGDRVYPASAPSIYFLTPMFHANVGTGGEERGICLDILHEKWSAINTLETVFNYVIALLCEPNPKSPLNSEAAKIKDPEQFRRAAQEHYDARIGQYAELLQQFEQ